MLVMKFGGTSVGVPAHCERALEAVRLRLHLEPVVVVSALAGVTNQLVELCRPGEAREALLDHVETRHLQHARALGVAGETVTGLLLALRVDPALAAPGEPVGREARDRVLAYGERLAAALFAAALTARGTEAHAVHAGEAGLVTDDRFGQANPLPEAPARLRSFFARQLGVSIVTGLFYTTAFGLTLNKEVWTLLTFAIGLTFRLLAIRYKWEMPKFVFTGEKK